MEIWTGVAFGVYKIFTWVGGQLLPGKEITFCCIGNKASGKTHCHACIDRGGKAVRLPRKPTTEPGRRVRNKFNFKEVTKRKLFWLHRDMPHNAEFIKQYLLEELPDQIYWILDTETWEEEYNLEILEALYDTLRSEEYRDATTKRSRTVPIKFNIKAGKSWKQTTAKKGNRCKQIIMVLNKMDEWLEVDPPMSSYEQLRKFDKVLTYYEQHKEAGPMIAYLDEEFEFEYLPTSFHRGQCLEADNLGGIPTKFTKWLGEAGKVAIA